MDPSLSTPCSRSSRQGAVFVRLYSFPFRLMVLTIQQSRPWHPCQSSLSGTKSPFPILQARCAQVSLLYPAPCCKLSAVLGSTNKSATSLFFSSLSLALSLLHFSLLRLSFFLILFSSFGRDPHPTVLKSDAGSDGTQPASCVDIQNRQSTYSCRCPMYGACQNNVFCGLFCSATLAIQCRSKAPFVHERLKTPNTSPQAVEPDSR